MNKLISRNELRREAVRQRKNLNGLDYLKVGGLKVNEQGEKRRTLKVYFLGKAPVSLEPSNLIIEGGRRIRDINVETVTVTHKRMAEVDDFMEVVIDKDGDFLFTPSVWSTGGMRMEYGNAIRLSMSAMTGSSSVSS